MADESVEKGEKGALPTDQLRACARLTILAIDPGTTESGWCVLHADGRVSSGVSSNWDLLAALPGFGADILAVEVFEARGMPIGHESIETILYTGRLMQAWARPLMRIKRSDVKRHLCGSLKARDANIRQALIDLFGGAAAIGRKATPGPLYGVTSHAWAALAVAITARESST